MVFCCVPMCKNTSKETILHILPKDLEHRVKWCTAIGREDLVNIDTTKRSRYRVCDIHFDDKSKFATHHNRTNLKARSIPCLHLPDVEESNTDNLLPGPSISNLEGISPQPSTSSGKMCLKRADVEESNTDNLLPGPSISNLEGISPQPSTSSGKMCLKRADVEESNTDNLLPGPSISNLEGISPQPSTSSGKMCLKRAGSPICQRSLKRTTIQTKDILRRTPTFRTDLRRKFSLLKSVGVNRTTELSPKASKLYRIARNLRRTARRLDLDNMKSKERIEAALEYAESDNNLLSKLNPVSVNFIQSQLKMQKKKPRGRRFTIEDKIFALSLLKQSPKGFRLLRQVFALPSRKTLMKILNKVPFACGINEGILASLKTSIMKMNPSDRLCTLLFDEMSIEPSLTYSKKEDSVEGFINCGEGKKLLFADHVMVFMVRGIRKKWKQPVAYFFTAGAMVSTDIVRNLKLIISSLNDIGFKVVATVCDQYSVNSTAINKLLQETKAHYLRVGRENRNFGFEINGMEVVPLFDPPHLLKGVRNNMLDTRVKFTWKKEEQVASWEDIVHLFKLDVGDCNTKMCYKLTEAHIYKEKMPKMKVKLAAQIFSHRVSTALRWTVKYGRENILPTSAEDTADFLIFFDQLFDSVNGAALFADHGKELRAAVTTSSSHIKFWNDAIPVLESIKFLTAKGETTPPTIRNWIRTIHGLKYLWTKLQQAPINLKYMCTRNLNQDPLENFFGCVRSHGARNINPTCDSFVQSFKSLIVNNFMSPQSPGANCEADASDALNDLKTFLLAPTAEIINFDETTADNFMLPPIQTENDVAIINTHAYIAGYIGKTILKIIGNCSRCRLELIASTVSQDHLLINEMEYRSRALLRPNSKFISLFSRSMALSSIVLPELILENNLKKTLMSIASRYFFNDTFSCDNHNMLNIFLNNFFNFFIFTYIKNINSILKGKSLCTNDHLKKLALDKFTKSKSRKFKIIDLKKNVT